MANVTIAEILAANGMPPEQIKSPQVTTKIARELKARGFRRVTRTVNGKRQRVWTNDNVSFADIVTTGLNNG